MGNSSLEIKTTLAIVLLASISHPLWAAAQPAEEVNSIRKQFEVLAPTSPAKGKEAKSAERKTFAEWDRQLREMEADLLQKVAIKDNIITATPEPKKDGHDAKAKLAPSHSSENSAEAKNPVEAKKKDTGSTSLARADIAKLEIEAKAAKSSVSQIPAKIESKPSLEQSAPAYARDASPEVDKRLAKIEAELAKQAAVSASLSRSMEQLTQHVGTSEGGSEIGGAMAEAAVVNEIRNLREKYAKLEDTTNQHTKALNDLETSTEDLKKEFNSSQDRIESLLSEVAEATHKLMADRGGHATINAEREDTGDGPLARIQRVRADNSMNIDVFDDWDETDLVPDKPGDDSPTAFVIAKKADLRSEPSKRAKILATIGKNSRVTVEKRVGDWYRVLAPGGKRAWAYGTDISFADDLTDLSRSALVRTGVDP